MNQPSEHLNPSDISGTWEPRSQQQDSTFDHIKTTVAEKLHTAAEALHEKTSRQTEGPGSQVGNDSLSAYGRQAAEWLDRSADYIEDLDPQQVKTDIENQVRQHPGRSLLIAGAVGLLLGVLIRRR